MKEAQSGSWDMMFDSNAETLCWINRLCGAGDYIIDLAEQRY